jgi:hypothetical protein
MRLAAEANLHCPDHLDCERMLRDTPPTTKERRSIGLLRQIKPVFDEAEALAFVRVFRWQISRAPGGVAGLFR